MKHSICSVLFFILLGVVATTICGCSSVEQVVEQSEAWRENFEPAPAKVEDEWTQAVLHTCPEEARGWPIVSQLTVKKSGGDYAFDTDRRELWPNVDGCVGNIVCLLYRDGKWHAGPCDGFRPFPSKRSASAFCVPDRDARTYEPISGEKVGMMVTGFCRNGVRMKPPQRTSIAWVIWP